MSVFEILSPVLRGLRLRLLNMSETLSEQSLSRSLVGAVFRKPPAEPFALRSSSKRNISSSSTVANVLLASDSLSDHDRRVPLPENWKFGANFGELIVVAESLPSVMLLCKLRRKLNVRRRSISH